MLSTCFFLDAEERSSDFLSFGSGKNLVLHFVSKAKESHLFPFFTFFSLSLHRGRKEGS